MNAELLKNAATATPAAATEPPPPPLTQPVSAPEPTTAPVKAASTREALFGSAAPAVPTTPAAGSSFDGIDSIADYLEGKIRETTTTTATAAPPVAPVAPATETLRISAADNPLAAKGVEISAEIYVEILEAVTGVAAAWYSGDETTDFAFNQKYKQKYKEITELIMKYKQVEVSPEMLFFGFTILIVGQVGVKAYQRKQEILKVSAYRSDVARRMDRQKPAENTGQLSMFPEAEQKTAAETLPTSGHSNVHEKYRKDFTIDSRGYFVKDDGHNRLKESERRRKPSAELRAFIDEFSTRHGRAPANKEVKQFLKVM